MTRAAVICGVALALGALGAQGCQSTQATSAEREEEGQVLLKSEKGVEVKKQNPDMKVLDTKMITDVNGTAVIVEVKNESDTGYANVPISIEVTDEKGKKIFENDAPGLVPSLTSIPVIDAGETFTWINDQILATGKPDSVDVKVGFSEAELPSVMPQIKVTQPELANDSFSGVEADGELELVSGPDQKDMTLFTVALRDGEIVAAGRSGVRRLVGDANHPTHFTTFFIGTPEEGDELVTTAPPAVLTEPVN